MVEKPTLGQVDAMHLGKLEVASLENMAALEENKIFIMFVNVCNGYSYSRSSQEARDKIFEKHGGNAAEKVR